VTLPSPAPLETTVETPVTIASVTPQPDPPLATAPAPAAVAAPTADPVATASPPSAPPPSALARSGWQIQVGAFPDERQARERIGEARNRINALLAKADPYTQKTLKGSTTLFRARFAGLDEDRARRACALLKRSDIACMAFRN
jgi:D-alanyl-D-alanine carboxypeptidase